MAMLLIEADDAEPQRKRCYRTNDGGAVSPVETPESQRLGSEFVGLCSMETWS
jgi:hypothetical protein